MIDLSFLVYGINLFFRVLVWLIFARILISWILPTANGPIVMFIFDTTEQILRPIRNLLPKGTGALAMIDWSPLIAIVAIDLLRGLVLSIF